MIRTDLGECCIYFEGVEYIFAPSFYAMSQIGTPKEIIKILKEHNTKSFAYNMLDTSCILSACCTSHSHDDLIDLIGQPKLSNKGHIIWQLGKMPMSELGTLQILASNLITKGVIGKPSKKRVNANPKPLIEFNATEYAAAAMVSFNLSREDAWSLTMVEFQSAIDAMYPDDDNTPTSEEMDALFAHTDKINDELNGRERG